MAYEKTNWQNSPSTNSPLNADNLNHIEQGIADAHDAIDNLPTELGYTIEATAATTISGKYIKPDTGEIKNIATNQKISEFTAIPEGAISFVFKGGLYNNPYILLIAFYSENGSGFISGVAPAGEDLVVPVPANAKYYVVSDNANSIGTVRNIDFEAIYTFNYAIKINSIKNDVEDLKDTLQASTNEIIPDFTGYSGYYIKSDGTLGTNASFYVSSFISLNEEVVSISIKGTNIVNNPYCGMLAFYKANSPTAANCLSVVFPSGVPVTVMVPIDAKYMLIGSNTNVNGQTTPINGGYYKNNIEVLSPIKDKIEQMEETQSLHTITDAVKIKAPSAYDLVVGDTFELFYKGIINSYKDNNFLIDASCPIGANYTNKFTVTPTEAGTTSLSLTLFDPYLKQMDTKIINLIARSTPSNPGNVKNVLCVGDSLTAPGIWVKEMARRISGNGGSPAGYNLTNVHFVGTCEKDGVNYEGYGGWTFTNYNTASTSNSFKLITCNHDKVESQDQHSIYKDSSNNQWKIETVYEGSLKIILTSGSGSTFPTTGTLTWVSGGVNHSDIVYTASENAPGNPFWDTEENKVDFGSYATRLNVSSIDYVFVLIGWNSAGSTKDAYKTQAQTFINNVKSSYPNAKIVLMGLQIPARDGLGLNYGAKGTWSKYINLMNFVHNLDDWYEELVASNSNVYHINISGQFDTEHNMPQATRAVNTRNSQTEIYQTNGVHPADSGYYQIADAAVRCFVGLL